MEKTKYYLYDSEGDENFLVFDSATELENHLLSIAQEAEITIEELQKDITIIKGKEISFTGKTIVGSIKIEDTSRIERVEKLIK